MSVFIIEHVFKSFVVEKQTNKVLKDINLSFPEKGFVSIEGKSGSGKSTLLNILMGIEKPTKGRVLYKGKNISKFSDKKFSNYHLNEVSLIYQHYNLFDNLKAIENAILPLRMKGYSKRKSIKLADEYFEKFNLKNNRNNLTKNLSGGEKQRVAIIRSLLTNPKVILCDEPTGALDSNNSIQIMEILKEISKTRLVIMVSHNEKLISKYSDQILVMKDGTISEIKGKIKQNLLDKNYSEKYKYKNSWIGKFLGLNLLKNFKKNIFTILCSIISFLVTNLSICFLLGSKSSQDEAINKTLSNRYAIVSKTEYIENKNSPIVFSKTLRPELNEIEEVFDSFSTINIGENFSYFLSNYSQCYINKKQILNYQFLPLFNIGEVDSSYLSSGSLELNEFCDVIVNEEFAAFFENKEVLNETFVMSNSASVTYPTGDKNNPYIKDVLEYSMKFKIVGIVSEFSFLNTPKIYYSYENAKNYLKSEKMSNLSMYLKKPISFYSYLENCEIDDPVCSYSYYLFLKDKSEMNKFSEKVDLLSKSKNIIQVDYPSKEIKDTYKTFIDSFSSTLIIFSIISFIGINFILGMLSLSSFIENKKDAAILTCLGAKNKSIYDLYLSENFLLVIIGFLLSTYLLKIFTEKLNLFLFKRFSLSNMILYSPSIAVVSLIIFILVSSFFVLIPMKIYRNKSITDELRDE